jgi:heme oxygenase
MSVLEKIRIETNLLHKRLDRLELTTNLMREGVNLKDYTNYLQCFYALHQKVEPLLYQQAQFILPAIKDNQRLASLKSDLMFFRVSPIEVSLQLDPRHFSKQACIGALYVMEGSRLGGRFIAKHLRKNLLLEDHIQFNYLEEKPKVAWSEIIELLSFSEHNESEEIIESAKYMFKFVEELLEMAFLKLNEEN